MLLGHRIREMGGEESVIQFRLRTGTVFDGDDDDDDRSIRLLHLKNCTKENLHQKVEQTIFHLEEPDIYLGKPKGKYGMPKDGQCPGQNLCPLITLKSLAFVGQHSLEFCVRLPQW